MKKPFVLPLAFSALVAASLGASCGGKVVVDNAGGSTSTGTAFACVGPYPSNVAFSCLSGYLGYTGDCPATTDHASIAAGLGVCDAIQSEGLCCGQSGLTNVLCGPTADQINEGCCYYYTAENPVLCYD